MRSLDYRTSESSVRGDDVPLTYTAGRRPHYAGANGDVCSGVHGGYSFALRAPSPTPPRGQGFSREVFAGQTYLNPTEVCEAIRRKV